MQHEGVTTPENPGHKWCRCCEHWLPLDVMRPQMRLCKACHTAQQAARWMRKNYPNGMQLTLRLDWSAQQRRVAVARAAKWNREHPEAHRELVRKRREKMGSKGRLKGVTRAQIQARRDYFGNACWMCGGPSEHMDHVKPIARGGLNLASNLRPACAKCNGLKSDLWPFDTSMSRTTPLVVARRALSLVNTGEFDERRFRITLRRLAA